MKKQIIIGLLFLTIPLAAATPITDNEWHGYIRIEGETATIWSGEITVGETTINAINDSTSQIEEYTIPYPSVLGALEEASKIAGFTYEVIYYPSWHAFYVKSINGESDWWHYWVDYDLPMVDAGSYELKGDNEEILWGYLETWYAHALRINVEKTSVEKNEEFTVTVFNETLSPVEDAVVHVGSEIYNTNEDGTVKIKLSQKGDYEIYAEKEGYVRSEKVKIHVKNILQKWNINNLIQRIEHLHKLLELLFPK